VRRDRRPSVLGLLRRVGRGSGTSTLKTAPVMSKLGPGEEALAVVKSVYAPEEKDNPRVTIIID